MIKSAIKWSFGANGDTYRGSFKVWKANEDHHRVKLPGQWMTRILKRNLAVLDGLMTLEAREVVSGAPNVELFKAVWAWQGRACAVVTERAFIARSGDTNHHAETAERALSGLQRKLAQLGCPVRRVRSSHEIDDAAFIKLYRRNDCMLTLEDASKSGSCEPGNANWCECVGIDPLREAIPLSEALEAFLLAVGLFRANLASTKYRAHFLRDLSQCQGRAIARRSEPLMLL